MILSDHIYLFEYFILTLRAKAKNLKILFQNLVPKLEINTPTLFLDFIKKIKK